MKILPSDSDFAAWSRIVPHSGDLLFSRTGKESWLREVRAPLLTVKEIKAQALTLWSLHHRSWYGYALNGASHCCWMPEGAIDALDPAVQTAIAATQVELKVPTILPAAWLSRRLRGALPEVGGRNHWLTCAAWSGSGRQERIALLSAWFRRNNVVTYPKIPLSQIPAVVKNNLRERGFDRLLYSFAAQSGPNCFGLAAAAIRGAEHAELWLHWNPLLKVLQAEGYRPRKRKEPVCGDILIFSRGGQAVHAAYCPGEGFYFEKPGQDFYEPYRIVRFRGWRREWQNSVLEIWGSE